MPTKFYLHNAANDQSGTYPTGSQATSPLATKTYEFTGSTSIKKMNTTKGTSQASMSGTSNASTSAQTVLLGMWTSPPLAAQTLGSAAITINMAMAQSSTSMNLTVEFTAEIYVWRPSTGAKVGTIHHNIDYSGDNEPSAANTEKVNQGTSASSTSVTCQAGDVIIVEIIDVHTQSLANSYTGTIYYDGTVENTVVNTTVSDHASYVNFSTDITFESAATISGSAGFTLGAATLGADADVSVSAAFSKTLAAATIAGVGDVAVSAAATITLAPVTIASVVGALSTISGSAALTLGAAAVVAAGTAAQPAAVAEEAPEARGSGAARGQARNMFRVPEEARREWSLDALFDELPVTPPAPQTMVNKVVYTPLTTAMMLLPPARPINPPAPVKPVVIAEPKQTRNSDDDDLFYAILALI